MQSSNGLYDPLGLWLGHLMFDGVAVLFTSTVIVAVEMMFFIPEYPHSAPLRWVFLVSDSPRLAESVDWIPFSSGMHFRPTVSRAPCYLIAYPTLPRLPWVRLHCLRGTIRSPFWFAFSFFPIDCGSYQYPRCGSFLRKLQLPFYLPIQVNDCFSYLSFSAFSLLRPLW